MGRAALISAVVLWGITFIPSKDLLHYMGPNTLSFARCLAGLLASADGQRNRLTETQ